MTDPLTDRGDDPIRAAFARLRDRELALVTPPGEAAARRTVRRRRQRAAVTATAGLTGLVLLAAAALTDLPSAGPERPLPPAAAAQPSGDPPGEDQAPGPEAERLAGIAMAGLESMPEPDGFTAIIGWSDPRTREPDQWRRPVPLEDNEPGEYLLQVSCGGTGQVTVTVRAGDQAATATAECATEPDQAAAGRGEATLTNPDNRQMRLTTTPDRAAQTGGVWVTALTRVGD